MAADPLDWYDTNWPDRYDYAARQSVLAPFAQQVTNGHFLHQTLWNWYFEPGTDKLTPGGMEKLDSLARTTPGPDTKIYIQTARDLVVAPENTDKIVAMRTDLDAKRAAAIQRYLNTQPGGAIPYEIAVHDAPVPGIPAPFVAGAYRGQGQGYHGGLSAGSGADDRQAVRDSLGIGHSITLEMGRKDEHVRLRVQRREPLRAYRAEHGNSIAERVTRDLGIKLSSGIAVARAVAGYRQPPR